MEEKNKEDTKEEKKIKKNNKKVKIIIIVIISAIILILSTIFALININNSNVISGVKIEGIDVSGLSAEEVKNKIQLIYNEKQEKDISLKYEEYETTISPKIIETNYDIDAAVKEAIDFGKDSNIFVNNYNILAALIGKKDIKVDMSINEEIAKQTIEEIGVNIPNALIEPDYSIDGENLIITKGKEGLKVDTSDLLERIKVILLDINKNTECIDIPVINKEPSDIDIDKIHQEVYKEVQDAYYTKDPFTIHPEVEGIDFDVEEARKMIMAEDKEQYTIKLVITKPKVTTSDIGSEAFPEILARYTTRYDASNTDRTTNLRIACQKINNKVVLPGETFSYNKALGVRSTATGYKNAKVYENGEVVDGIGGGICQISSTLYNAILMANLETVERRNHQFVTSYTPAGRDATVVYGQTDFRFKNTRTYAIKINASISNGIATVSIYGIKEENEYNITFETKQISTIPYTVKYVDDNSIEVGTEKVKQKGTNGVITETYIIKSLNGKVVSKELLSKDTYNAMQKIILKGTKGATVNNINEATNNQEEVKKQEENVIKEETKEEEKTTVIENDSNENKVNKTNQNVIKNEIE